MGVVDRARAAIAAAFETWQAGSGGVDVPTSLDGIAWVVERPKRPEHGDLATNVAMALAKRAGKPPRAIAEELVKALAGGDVVASAEVAGPGLREPSPAPGGLPRRARGRSSRAGRGWGRAPSATGERIDLEFVSANPTGPVTVASGRNAILGDAVARLLEARRQPRHARVLHQRPRQPGAPLRRERRAPPPEGRDAPEDGYKGAYVAELAAWLKKRRPAAPRRRRRRGPRPRLRHLDAPRHPRLAHAPRHPHRASPTCASTSTCGSARSRFTAGAPSPPSCASSRRAATSSQRTARSSSRRPRARSKTRTASSGRATATWTYFASDIAYFADKIARGYDRLINVLGADHHGYVARVRNALDGARPAAGALRGAPLPARLHHEGRRGREDGQARRQHRHDRRGDGRDRRGRRAARAPAPTRSASSSCRGARTRTSSSTSSSPRRRALDNPVFYVQYGYARLCSIQRNAQGARPRAASSDAPRPARLGDARAPRRARDRARRSATSPTCVAEAARLREPHRIVFYVQELAREFQSYFTRLKDENDPILPPSSTRAQTAGWEASWDFGKTRARLAWIEAIRVDLRAGARAPRRQRAGAHGKADRAETEAAEPEAASTPLTPGCTSERPPQRAPRSTME